MIAGFVKLESCKQVCLEVVFFLNAVDFALYIYLYIEHCSSQGKQTFLYPPPPFFIFPQVDSVVAINDHGYVQYVSFDIDAHGCFHTVCARHVDIPVWLLLLLWICVSLLLA